MGGEKGKQNGKLGNTDEGTVLRAWDRAKKIKRYERYLVREGGRGEVIEVLVWLKHWTNKQPKEIDITHNLPTAWHTPSTPQKQEHRQESSSWPPIHHCLALWVMSTLAYWYSELVRIHLSIDLSVSYLSIYVYLSMNLSIYLSTVSILPNKLACFKVFYIIQPIERKNWLDIIVNNSDPHDRFSTLLVQ